MEASGVSLRRAPFCTGESWMCGRRGKTSKRVVWVPGARFVDDGHLKYYVSCGERKKEEKKRAKLVKGLEKDLSVLYSMGLGVSPEDSLTAEVKSKMISEAAELLLKQLKQLRVEEKEMKRKRKEEKAARKAAKKMKDLQDDSESSCSSSQSEIKPECRPPPPMEFKSPDRLMHREDCCISNNVVIEKPPPPMEFKMHREDCCISSNVVIEKPSTPVNKIEVCMGGKCKRSGALQLLEEIDKKVGMEGAVVGCKCMGKCRDGPNVKVLKHGDQDNTLKHVRNPLHIGVALEDVDTIVANFLGENMDLALSAA
ncbi:hypothetical protein J5N97_014207 [Dioscorea zingiberensis]|uniref:Diacylglycerol O-acyltransferase 3 n=1 Tax=Dioscorea zingiberensis TaxID=325984 RepID=A0A9D5CST0_9LILI|nr:hypothetical protein J5N97_014207 [Dioscorea zingiberensis]